MAKIKKIDDELKLAEQGVKTATDNFNNMSYDNFKQGSMYQGLQKSYSQQGQRAMKDTLGQVAARTGGMASSYANTASQQAYNNYMQQLEDVARAMYNDEYSKARDKVSLAQNEYDRLYGEKRDELSDQRYEDEQAYLRGRDALSDQRYNTEREEARVANDAYYGNALDYATYKANGGTLSEQAYNSIVAAAKGKYTDDHYEQNLTAKATRDAELKGIFGAEGFTWGDWDGDGVVEGIREAKTFEDLYGGSSYGEDYWKAYAAEAAQGYKETNQKNAATHIQEYLNAGLTLKDAIESLGYVYANGRIFASNDDGTVSEVSLEDVTGHTLEYWESLTTPPPEEEPEFKGVSGTDFATYYDYFSDIAPGDVASAQKMADAIEYATGNRDLAMSLYELWQSQNGKG
jgi:hypothetical protein